MKIRLTTARMLFWFLRLYLLALFFSPFIQSALAFDEKFDVYNSPQALGMGKAFTAEATGYNALFYNPAGLAKQSKRNVEVTVIDFEGIGGTGAIGRAFGEQTVGPYRLPGVLAKNPNQYHFMQFSVHPNVIFRGIGIGLIGTQRYAGISDGTNLTVDTVTDVGAVVGVARSFAGNLLRLGINAKAITRNQMKGIFAHSTLATHDDSTFPTLYKEGLGIGADFGGQLVFPNKMLPTLAFCWKDIADTRFLSSTLLNKQASGTPDPIRSSVNAGASIHPYFTQRLKSTISAEMRHIESGDMPLRKRLHFGVQLEDEKSLFFWFGASQLYPSAGVGYRVKGGNLEIGTYGEDIGEGQASKEDRRVFFRYTVGF